MKQLELARKYRLAGGVKRWHVQPTLRQQTVAEHSFGVMMLIRQVVDGNVFSDESILNMLLAAMHHDLPELMTGDIPADVKRRHPDLDAMLTRIEMTAEDLYFDTPLTAVERDLVKWADTMELILWCLEEIALGNTNMRRVVTRAVGYLTLNVPVHGAALTTEVLLYCDNLGLINP